MALSRSFASDMPMTSFGDPFGMEREFRRLQRDMNRLMSQTMGPASMVGEFSGFPTTTELTSYSPRVDVREMDKSILIHADLPGIPKENVRVEARDNNLIISGETSVEGEKQQGTALVRERFQGKFMRQLPLPDTVDLDSVRAKFDNGVLEIEMPKKESGTSARRIALE